MAKKSKKKSSKKISNKRLIEKIEGKMPPLYLEYLELVTPSEVSTEFHVFVFMNMIAALAGDRIFFREGNENFYPHIWTLLLGGSGVGRKSTAMHSAVKVLAKTGKVNMLAAKGSSEGFFKELVENDGVGLMRHSELGSLLGAISKDYNMGFADDLCEMYDPMSASIKKRLANATSKIDHLAVTWMAASTPDSLNKCGAHSRIAGGFLPRWNIVFGGMPKTFINFRKAKCADYFDSFVKKMIGMWPVKAYEMKFSDAAVECHKVWYDRKRPRMADGLLGNFEIRILEVAKKYAVLMAFLGGRKQVFETDMATATMFGDYFFESVRQLIQQELSESRFESDCQKITKAMCSLKGRGKPITQRAVMKNTNLKKWDYDKCVETMRMRGDITIHDDCKTLVMR